MEKCVVATTIGAEGLDYDDRRNIVVADGSGPLAEAVSDVLSRPEFRDQLGRAGRGVVLRRHNPDRISEEYFARLRRVCAETASREAPMRVLFDMRWMVPGRAGGIENLARSFISQLASLDHYNQYSLLVPAECRHDFDVRGRSNMRVVALDSSRALLRREWLRLRSRVARRLRLHDWQTPAVQDLRWLKDLDVDIAYSFPGFIHPQLYPLRQVLVVPDIQHEFLPHFFSQEALAERRRLYTESIHRADHICAISEFTRQTLIDRLGVTPAKVTTVHLAADDVFSAGSADAAADAVIVRSHGLEPRGYLFLPAHTWHHKNHRAAVEALRVLRDRYGDRPILACSGGPREAQPALEAQIAACNLHQQVRFLGYCRRGDLAALFRQAACLVFPSLFEGFGMPVLEAMASGCPVVCSNTTSLPEIAGDAALLVDPEDPEAIAKAIRQVMTDGALRQELVARGLRRASAFSWRRHTLESLAVIRRVHLQMRNLPCQ
jgi:glycosyltransferase involved in cell wall biosynthesis